MKAFLSLFTPAYPKTIVYMLQSTEYNIKAYLKWYWRTSNFSKVSRRRTLQHTRPARLLLIAIRLGMTAQIICGLLLMYLWGQDRLVSGWLLGFSLIISYPVIWAHAILLPLVIGRLVLIKPSYRGQISKAETIFASHKGIKIAVAGSYGKTSMKELLASVLGSSMLAAATPANKNTMASLAEFGSKLSGQEDVLIMEFGEEKPGDIAKFSAMTHPTHGIITGLAPAHLDQYQTIDAAGQDIISLAEYLGGKNVYINGESEALTPLVKDSYNVYSRDGFDGWRVINLESTIEGVRFLLKKDKKALKIRSPLLGRHQVGPLVAAAVLGLELGMDERIIETAIAATKPYEHRMQPYKLGGAWIIDDTYNGNIEGIRAGLELLSELPAIRKMYVTPGLVGQGVHTAEIHQQLGRMISKAQPDRVVLMDNSAAKHIYAGLAEEGYTGEVQIEEEPLEFYTNLDQFVATGDLVLMQNDWTDNYR